MGNSQDKELKTFGFISNKLRAGLVTGIITLLIVAITYLTRLNRELQRELITTQEKLYSQIVEEVRKQVNPAVVAVKESAAKVDSVAHKVSSVADSIAKNNINPN